MQTAQPAFYRSVDAIDNLVVRVAIRRQADVGGDPLASGALPPVTLTATLAAATAGAGATMRASAAPMLPAALSDDALEHVVEFGWQQKVFGPR